MVTRDGRMGLRRTGRPAENLADEDLIRLVGDGDEDAFALLYDRHSVAAYSLAVRMLGDRESAEDVVQDAFLAVYRSARTYTPGRASVRSWLLAMVRNRGIDRIRTARAITRRQQRLESEAAVAQSRDTQAVAMERAIGSDVRSRLDDLPGEQAAALKLAYYGGFSHSEIAQFLEVPVGTVKGRIRLGLHGLRARVGEPGGGE